MATRPAQFSKVKITPRRGATATTIADIPFEIQTVAGQTAKALRISDSLDAELFSVLPNGDGAAKYAEVTIPAASVLTLFSVPYTLVAAPGVGRILEFLSALVILDYGTAAYAGIGATEDLAVRYTDASGAIVSTTLETTGFLDATADALRTLKAISTDLTPVANAALKLGLLNGDITTGDSPLRVKVSYRVHSTGL